VTFTPDQIDFCLVKTDSAGNLLWNKTYSNPGSESAFSLAYTKDGGFVLAGFSGEGMYMVKADANGTLEWSKTIGSHFDIARSIIQTSDGGFALTGIVNSSGLNGDMALIKMDQWGTILWAKSFGVYSFREEGFSVIQTREGGYAMTGFTETYGNQWDVYVVKANALGGLEWTRTYGGWNLDAGYSIIQAKEGGYIVAGETGSFGAGGFDMYLVKTDSEVGLEWVDSTPDMIVLYRGRTDQYWNFVRVRLWKISP
jgi:hypothetical protein